MCGGLYILQMTEARHRQCVPVLLISIFLFFVGAAGVNGSETRHHDAHVHGIGKLNVALDGSNLIIELTSPAANVVGFEHAPENEQQSHEVHEAIELLENGEELFVLTAKAQCTLHKAHVESNMGLGEHQEHGAHEHEHSHSGKDHDAESTHSEFEVAYHFECGSQDSLKDIDVLLFSHFPGFEKIVVQMLTPKGQTAVELTPNNFHLSL